MQGDPKKAPKNDTGSEAAEVRPKDRNQHTLERDPRITRPPIRRYPPRPKR
jgi:hypothetical protein